jgi:hypothetical protein
MTGPHEGPGPFIPSERPGPLDWKGRRVAPRASLLLPLGLPPQQPDNDYGGDHKKKHVEACKGIRISHCRTFRLPRAVKQLSGNWAGSTTHECAPESGAIPPQRRAEPPPRTAWPSAQPRNSRLLPPSRPPPPQSDNGYDREQHEPIYKSIRTTHRRTLRSPPRCQITFRRLGQFRRRTAENPELPQRRSEPRRWRPR